jgi:hypothetical protein
MFLSTPKVQMHTITLSFPTLTELAAAVARIAGAPAATVEAAPAPKPKAEKPALSVVAAASVEAAPTPAPSPAPAAAAPVADKAASGVDYPTLQKAVFKLVGIDKAAAAAVAAALNTPTFKVLPAERFAEALAAVEEKLAELAVA